MQKSSSDNSSITAEQSSEDATTQDVTDTKNAGYSKDESIESNFYDDLPIERPEQDLFGYGLFADTIAKCILGIKKPNGGVIAIHGPWGSGKSSLINLVCNNIRNQKFSEPDKMPIIIPFNSWCYRTEKGIVAGFFKELHSGLVNWKSDKANIDASIDPHLVRSLAFSVLGAYAASQWIDICSLNDAESILSKCLKSLSKRKNKKQNIDSIRIEDLQHEIGKMLGDSGARVLIIIDDIDRLSEEEAKSVFRIIKSVGRIQNVMYLVAYDREIAEAMFDKEYTSEGSHYLEKIIQANFDLPEPAQSTIVNFLNFRMKEIFGCGMLATNRRMYDIVHDVVIPEMKNLRSVHRLANMLSVTYKSVKQNVDLPDFIALETFRLFHPHLYQAIRSRKSILTRSVQYPSGTIKESSDREIENIYLFSEPVESRPRLKRCLVDIFPSIVNTFVTPRTKDLRQWEDEKRVRSAIHFDTYFRFFVSEDVVSNDEFQEFARNASNEDYIKSYFMECINRKIEEGKSKASFMLDMISQNVDSIDRDKVTPLLYAIYSISGELTKSNEWFLEFGHFVTNSDRIRRLTQVLLEDRFEYTHISDIVTSAVRRAPLNFQLEICRMSYNFHHNSTNTEPHDIWGFIGRDETLFLKEHALNDVRIAASDGTIFDYDDVLSIFENWQSISDDKEEIKNIFNVNFEYSDRLVRCAYEFGRIIPSISHDDIHTRASLRRLGEYIDFEHFERRLNEYIQHGNLNERDMNIINRLLDILKLREKGGQKS